ncbi:MAG: hypothetical protein NC332_01770 [Firmicutes bacterium]|nr:hypothetical protein [Bacillota bacterium]
MIECKLNNDMLAILKSMVDSQLVSFELDDDKVAINRTFGVIRINASSNSIDVYNEVHDVEYFGTHEDISYFTCKTVDSDDVFRGYCEQNPVKKINVNEKILGVQIVSDRISISSKNYYVEFDRAIIIKTISCCFIISREWHFMETMLLTCNKSIDEIIPVQNVINHWNNDGELKVDIKRIITDL